MEQRRAPQRSSCSDSDVVVGSMARSSVARTAPLPLRPKRASRILAKSV